MIYGKVDNPPAQPFQNIGMAVNVLQIIFCIHIWIEVASADSIAIHLMPVDSVNTWATRSAVYS